MIAGGISRNIDLARERSVRMQQFPINVLVIDDEPVVRSVMQGMLQILGCSVVLCSSGSEALSLLSTNPREFRMVFCDLKLGGLQGRALFERIISACPEIVTVVMSGRIESDEVEEFRSIGVRGFLSKPFNIESLRSELSRLLQS